MLIPTPVANLGVFQKAYDLSLEIHHQSLEIPQANQYGSLADQMRRASKSICANLVEGLGKNQSPKDKRRFVNTAIGSCDEVKLWLMYARDLGYIDQGKVESLGKRYSEVGRMLYGLLQSIQSQIEAKT